MIALSVAEIAAVTGGTLRPAAGHPDADHPDAGRRRPAPSSRAARW